MSVIFKYPLNERKVTVPFYNTRVVSVGLDPQGIPSVWLEHIEPPAEGETRNIYLVFTGETYDSATTIPIGSFVLASLVYHVLLEL